MLSKDIVKEIFEITHYININLNFFLKDLISFLFGLVDAEAVRRSTGNLRWLGLEKF